MEITICQWYSAYKNQLRSKTSSHITPSGMKYRVQTLCQNCASGNQEHKARKVHGKARSTHHGRKVPQWKTGRKEELKDVMDIKSEQLKQIAHETKEARWKSFSEELRAGTTLAQFWQSTNKWKGMIVPKQPQTQKTPKGQS